jgi:hypothetical protein
MSYCKIITFKNGKPAGGVEFQNAWGGAARIWNALFEKHLKNPFIQNHSWLCSDKQALWDLAKRKTSPLPECERAVHASTFDRAYVNRQNFPRFCADLRSFDVTYPVAQAVVNHLSAWADTIEKLGTDVEAIGFLGTSVGENLWVEYDQENDRDILVPLTDGWEVYDWLTWLDQQP